MLDNKLGLSEGLIIAVIPAAGYWFAFLYELGYCKYFDIPVSFVEVGLVNILISLVGILGLIGLANIYANAILFLFKDIPEAIKSALLRVSVPTLFMAGYGLVAKLSSFFIPLIVITFPLIFIEFILPCFAQRNVKGYLAKLEAQKKIDLEHDSFTDLIAKKMSKGSALSILLVFILSFVSYFSGGYNAKGQTDFIVLTGEKESVVLKMYNSYFIAASFKRESKSVSAEYKLIPVDENLSIFKFEKIGPLQPNGL